MSLDPNFRSFLPALHRLRFIPGIWEWIRVFDTLPDIQKMDKGMELLAADWLFQNFPRVQIMGVSAHDRLDVHEMDLLVSIRDSLFIVEVKRDIVAPQSYSIQKYRNTIQNKLETLDSLRSQGYPLQGVILIKMVPREALVSYLHFRMDREGLYFFVVPYELSDNPEETQSFEDAISYWEKGDEIRKSDLRRFLKNQSRARGLPAHAWRSRGRSSDALSRKQLLALFTPYGESAGLPVNEILSDYLGKQYVSIRRRNLETLIRAIGAKRAWEMILNYHRHSSSSVDLLRPQAEPPTSRAA